MLYNYRSVMICVRVWLCVRVCLCVRGCAYIQTETGKGLISNTWPVSWVGGSETHHSSRRSSVTSWNYSHVGCSCDIRLEGTQHCAKHTGVNLDHYSVVWSSLASGPHEHGLKLPNFWLDFTSKSRYSGGFRDLAVWTVWAVTILFIQTQAKRIKKMPRSITLR